MKCKHAEVGQAWSKWSLVKPDQASAKHFALDSSGQSHTEPQSPQASPFWTIQSRQMSAVVFCEFLYSLPQIMLEPYTCPDYILLGNMYLGGLSHTNEICPKRNDIRE